MELAVGQAVPRWPPAPVSRQYRRRWTTGQSLTRRGAPPPSVGRPSAAFCHLLLPGGVDWAPVRSDPATLALAGGQHLDGLLGLGVAMEAKGQAMARGGS